jgi:hypothetical protein
MIARDTTTLSSTSGELSSSMIAQGLGVDEVMRVENHL